MRRTNRFLFIFLIVSAVGVISLEAGGDGSVDVEYASHMPLATHSVLLDITRVGDTLVAVGERGHIVLSTDGNHWTQAEVVPTRSTLTSVYSLGSRLWAGGHDAVILTSGDQGKTWTRLFFEPDRQQAIMDIYFVDENIGLAIGSYGLYLITLDGGQTWQQTTIDPESDFHLNKLLNLGNGRWLIAGEAGFSYRSDDDRKTWQPMDMPYPGSMWGAVKTNSGCVLFFGLRGHALESCDSGAGWAEIETGSEASISGAAEDDGTILLAANSGTVLTRNAAGEFTVHHHSSGVDFAAALALGDGNFLLVGEDGVHKFPEQDEQDNGGGGHE